MNAKKIKVMHQKKGLVELGSLSHNELCRGFIEQAKELQEAQTFIKNSGPVAKAWKDQRDYYLKLIRSKNESS